MAALAQRKAPAAAQAQKPPPWPGDESHPTTLVLPVVYPADIKS